MRSSIRRESFRSPVSPLLAFATALVAAVALTSSAFGEEPSDASAAISDRDLPVRCRLVGSFPLASDQTYAWVGGSWIERMQEHDDLELCLTVRWHAAQPKFRNLGWGGDTVSGESRAVFGEPKDGYARLISDLDLADPDVVLLAYGSNEAFDGLDAKPAFLERYERLIDDMESRDRRVVLVTPPPMEPTIATARRIEEYNRTLASYAISIVELAERRKLPVLETTLATLEALPSDAPQAPAWTIDGQKLTREAYLALGRSIADVVAEPSDGTAKIAADAAKGDSATKIVVPYAQLPLPMQPLREGEASHLELGELIVRGLASGRYSLTGNGLTLATADANAWSDGVAFERNYAAERLHELQATIQHKNWLFFQRHRPQNETYLFLFRKHEQGNNAVEIPQFDPLIAAAEAEIAELAEPAETTLTLAPAK